MPWISYFETFSDTRWWLHWLAASLHQRHGQTVDLPIGTQQTDVNGNVVGQAGYYAEFAGEAVFTAYTASGAGFIPPRERMITDGANPPKLLLPIGIQKFVIIGETLYALAGTPTCKKSSPIKATSKSRRNFRAFANTDTLRFKCLKKVPIKMNNSKVIRGGALLARALKEKGVDHVFTLAGGFCNPALEGFMECQMPVINTPHEQIAGHLADGHARITRKPTVCLVGPEGFANAVPAMLEAGGERSPVIFVTGSSTLKRQGAGGFKEIDDVAIAAPLVKYSAQITDGARISEFVNRAWTAATTGYPGPVHISLPVDIMFSSFEADAGLDERPSDRSDRPVPRAWPEPSALKAVLDIVRRSERPVIIGGHGVWWSKSEDKLEAAGRALRLPIFNVPYHSKLLGEECEAYMGLADFHQYHPSKAALHEADLVLMIGGRLDNQMNFGNPPFFPKEQTLVCINGSHEELENNLAADELLLSDPGAFLDALMGVGRSWPDWFNLQKSRRAAWVEEWYDHIAAETAKPGKMHPLQLSLDVQAQMGDDDWLIFDGGNTHFWSEIAVNMAGWRGQKLGGIMHPGNYSLLGVGVSFGVSAKSVHPGRNVVVISGDGAFLSGGLSIESAFQDNLPITIVIDNNGGLDCISQQQERLFENGQHFATDFRDIPYHAMCEGLGGHGELVETRDQLAPALKRAMASGKTAIVNVKCRGVISPIVAATSDKRDKASIE